MDALREERLRLLSTLVLPVLSREGAPNAVGRDRKSEPRRA